MSISESHFKFSFKIEPKPEGGFIARSEDLDCTLEGATREQVEGKIRAKIAEISGIDIADALPLEKLGQSGVNVNIQKKFTFKRAGDERIADASTGQLESPTPAPIEPPRISLTTLMKVLIVLVILLILLVLLRR